MRLQTACAQSAVATPSPPSSSSELEAALAALICAWEGVTAAALAAAIRAVLAASAALAVLICAWEGMTAVAARHRH